MAVIGPRTIVLLSSAARTSSGQGVLVTIPGRFTAAKIRLRVSAASGTSETLNVFIQDGMRDIETGDLEGTDVGGSYVWDDFAAFTQMTGAGNNYIRVVGGGNVVHAGSDSALSAASVRNGPIGDVWRVDWNIGGTNPSFTFYVLAQLLP
jgi:hypothetical protein